MSSKGVIKTEIFVLRLKLGNDDFATIDIKILGNSRLHLNIVVCNKSTNIEIVRVLSLMRCYTRIKSFFLVSESFIKYKKKMKNQFKANTKLKTCIYTAT